MLKSQTVVQPDAPPDLVLPQEIQIPLVLMWSPKNFPSKEIVPDPPQEATVAEVRPSLAKPNHEVQPADIQISATSLSTEILPTPPSTTAPLIVHGPSPLKQTPEMASEQLEQPTPTRVMSISDFQTKGPVVIPPGNRASQAAPSESLVPGNSENSSGRGNGNPASTQNGVGPGQGADGQKENGGTGAGSAGKGGVAVAGATQASESGSVLGNEASLDHIRLPKDGQFGVVVVGSSLAEQYPETVGIWSSRLVYTVYLHVGFGKNWILQYSIPRSDEAAAAGSVTRPEAPWPYDIVRPHLSPSDYTAEAIIVHGFVNLAGRFERLGVIFPPELTQPKILLSVLQQWQFRPARQNGQFAAVEILLIIPEEVE